MRIQFAYRLFAILDIISIALLSKQIYVIDLKHIPDETLSRVRIGIMFLMYILLFVSATGLWLLKKWGGVAYFVQFPFRLTIWIFSFGFLTIVQEFITTDVFEWMFRILMILEFMRLYFTFKLQKEAGI